MPINQPCVICETVQASFRCRLCGPCGFFCWECFKSCHKHIQLFHVAEKWEVRLLLLLFFLFLLFRICVQHDHFEIVERTIDHPDVRVKHQCSSEKKVLLECLDEYGKIKSFSTTLSLCSFNFNRYHPHVSVCML